MLDTYPDTFTMVQIHLSDGFTYPWGTARQSFYGIQYIPTTVFGGVTRDIGNLGFNGYQNRYNQRRAVPTDVTIELSGEQVSGRTYRFSAEVCIEPDGEAKTMRIYMVQVLDYWPAVGGYHRNGFKQAAAAQDIALSPGECQVVQHEFTFDDDSWNNRDNITIVAWAQVPNNSWPAEVYQAAIMDWPFTQPECVGDLDGDGDTDQGDLGLLLADWGCDDPVNGCAGDLNDDDKTNQEDLGILLADYGCDLNP